MRARPRSNERTKGSVCAGVCAGAGTDVLIVLVGDDADRGVYAGATSAAAGVNRHLKIDPGTKDGIDQSLLLGK